MHLGFPESYLSQAGKSHCARIYKSTEGDETLTWVSQGVGRHPIPGIISGWIVWGSEQFALVKDNLADCRVIGLDHL